MRRVASFLVPGSLVVLVGWTFGAAWPRQAARDVPPPVEAPPPPTVVSQMDAEVARLHARNVAPPPFAAAERDPFTFGADRRARPAVAPVAPPPPQPAVVVLELPRLVAVTSKTTPAGVIRTAVFAVADGVKFAHPGDTVGQLVVRSISDGTVELVDPVTGKSYNVR
jgi:hypothetical protein